MYGLWLFKEIKTEYGYCKLEIYRKGYDGSQIEIGALSADSINISLENLGAITDPIGKSVCSFSIIDTEQVNYEDFFTPDATAYKVVVSTRVGTGSYTTRWSGFITPDFFAENLSYRTPISLTARDNIGYLADVDFDLPNSTITVRELITSAFAKISDNYPMKLEFASQKQTVEGVLAIDATISTALLRDMTWYEALETVLHDLGLQMRWVDNNTIAVIDVSQIPEYYATQGFNFINASGYREILPAWREFRQDQNYGAFDNFYRGQINGADKLEYAANSAISSNVLLYQPAPKTQWAREGAIYFLNLFNSYNQYIDDNKAESIYVTGIAPTATNAEVLATKMVYSQVVTQVNKQIELKFNLNDTLRTPVESLYTRGEYNVFYLPYSTQTGGASGGISQIKTPRPYQLKYRFNIFLRCEDGSNYVMREDWVDASTVNTEQPFIEFTTEKLKTANTNISDAQGNKRFVFTGYNNDEEYSITINSIPKAGTLEFVVYPWTFEGEDTAREAATYQRGARISDIQFAVKLNITGITSGTLVGENHNVKSNYDYQFGQVPKFDGDLIVYAGGLFYGDTLTAINGFQRNAEGENYNLLELVGREVIHFNKKNYNKLSGTIKNLNKEPLMFNRLFEREGKTYAPYSYSLNVISNEMNITTMQEVEPYETASFTQIESEVTTGGATVSGGNNTVLQYSENAGNAKRIYELNTATATEKNDGYLLLDNPSFGEAKKVHISEVKDTQLRAEVEALRNDFDELNALLSDDTADVIDTWNEVVKFLEGYKEDDNLASILSGMQSDFLTLQDNVGVIATDLSNLSVKVNDIDERVIALEELGLSLVVTDGKTYVRSKYNFYSDGGLTAAGIGTPGGGGGTGGGSNVSYKGELSSGMLLGTITINGMANKIYGPSVVSQLANDMGYITFSVLDGYLPRSGGEISGPITWGSGKFGVDGTGEGIYMKWGEKTLHLTNDGLFYNWKYILHTDNYTNYCATKDHNHDDRYYTESEINTLLGGYYGKSEVNNLLNGKSNNGHKHVKADITDFPTSMPASDVYAWAKAATKPTYTSAEVGLGNVQNYGTFSQTAFMTGVSYPVVNKGVMEIGDRVDFHSIEGGNDYEVSLRIKSGETTARKIYFPSAEGTLALVSQVDTVNNSLNTHITAYNTFKSSAEQRLAELERMFEWDGTNIKAKANFYSVGGLSGAGNSPTQGGGSGTTVSFAQYVSSGIALGTLTINGVTTNNTIYAPNALSFYTNDVGYVTSSALAGYFPSSGGTISGNLTVGSANAGYNVAGGILSSGEIAGTHKIRVNAANNAGNYAFMRAQTYSDNRALLILGSCYGSVGPINDDAADYIAITTYKNTVGIGRFFEGSELYTYDKSSTKLAVAGNVNVTGTVTQGSDIRYKTVVANVEIDINAIANAPVINYVWKNGIDNRVHLGSTAQYWANTNLANGVITTTDATMWTMAYGEIALAGVVSVAKKVLNHEERIAALEKENKELKEKLYGVQ